MFKEKKVKGNIFDKLIWRACPFVYSFFLTWVLLACLNVRLITGTWSQCVTGSQSGWDLKVPLETASAASCSRQGQWKLGAQDCAQASVGVSKGGDCEPLSNLFYFFLPPSEKKTKIPVMFKQFPVFQFLLIFLSFHRCTTEKSLFQSSLCSLSKYWDILISSPLSLLVFKLSSQLLVWQILAHVAVFMTLCWTCSGISVPF